MSISSSQYRMTNADVERERERFDEAHRLLREGRLEDARRVAWWPANEELPREHWSRIPHVICWCGKPAPDGVLGLCGRCGGATSATPTVIPTRRRS